MRNGKSQRLNPLFVWWSERMSVATIHQQSGYSNTVAHCAGKDSCSSKSVFC